MDVGFVYVWYDRYRKMLYIGSHIGTFDDGYLGSNKRLKHAYAKRPTDFMRRILFWFEGNDRTKLYEVEQQWLDLIPTDELGKRFYNLKKKANGGSQKGHSKSKKMREKLSQYRLGKVWS